LYRYLQGVGQRLHGRDGGRAGLRRPEPQCFNGGYEIKLAAGHILPENRRRG
jgi:hypothetical protein